MGVRVISPTVAVLRRFRELEGTQKKISKRTGIPLRTIERFESGATAMTVPQMEKYLEALDITFLDLAVAMLTGDYSKSKSIESAAKLLPKEVREAHFRYLVALGKAIKK